MLRLYIILWGSYNACSVLVWHCMYVCCAQTSISAQPHVYYTVYMAMYSCAPSYLPNLKSKLNSGYWGKRSPSLVGCVKLKVL